ncbi:TetR/AcrR family transcriptional regulator [Labedella endophytica]|uniref:TetR/AcrR family transcriptional regulator n=1 Tax=Labedella endophytica TaxID=1523160 RepID=UPI00140A0DCD|nr:TetR/AcrR family transcriptional regulator [Labedella endophytica]
MAGRRGSREIILDAVVTVLASRGSDALSIRNVAAQAGVSVGSVQHNFPTRDALVVGAMTAVNDRFRARVRALLEHEESAEARLRVFCSEISCVTDAGLADAVVWTSFAARASTDEDIRAIHASDWARTEDVLLRLLTDAFPDSSVTADDAALVLAVTDGIAVARAAEQSDRMTTERALRLIDATLAPIAARARP